MCLCMDTASWHSCIHILLNKFICVIPLTGFRLWLITPIYAASVGQWWVNKEKKWLLFFNKHLTILTNAQTSKHILNIYIVFSKKDTKTYFQLITSTEKKKKNSFLLTKLEVTHVQYITCSFYTGHDHRKELWRNLLSTIFNIFQL